MKVGYVLAELPHHCEFKILADAVNGVDSSSSVRKYRFTR